MIVVPINNTSPFSSDGGLAIKYVAPSVSAPIAVVKEQCYCFGCEYVEKVFYDGDGESYKNDKSSFLFAKKKTSDTIALELWKNGVKVADMIDDTYGTFYNDFDNKPLYKGYLVEWLRVFSEHGYGSYRIKAELDILGVVDTYESRLFSLVLFSEGNANGTVKIETFQNGNIMSSEFDFTDLLDDGWYQSLRIPAKFGYKNPVLEQDNYLDSNYAIAQIQDKLITEYTLRSKYITADVSNEFFYNNILANRIYITDYNIQNHEKYTQVDVVPLEPEEVETQNFDRKVRHTWKFKNRIENTIKTNY